MEELEHDPFDKTIDQVYDSYIYLALSLGAWMLLGGLLGASIVARFGPAVGIDHAWVALAAGVVGSLVYLYLRQRLSRRPWKEYERISTWIIAMTFVVLLALVGYAGPAL